MGIFQLIPSMLFSQIGEEIAVRNFKGEFDHQTVKGTLWKLGLQLSDKVDDVGLTLVQLHQIMMAFIRYAHVNAHTRLFQDRNASCVPFGCLI